MHTVPVAALAACTIMCGCSLAKAPPTPQVNPTPWVTPIASIAVPATTGLVDDLDSVAAGLDAALASYRAGDRDAAYEAVVDAYLNHFERVEHAPSMLDRDEMLDLERLIAGGLLGAIKSGRPADEVAGLVRQAKAGLTTAQKMLQ